MQVLCLLLTNGEHNVLQNAMNEHGVHNGTKRKEIGFTERW